MQGWLQRPVAVDLFTRAGLDFEQLKKEARTEAFRPIELKGTHLTADYRVKHTRADSFNVLGILPGSKRPAESIMWRHALLSAEPLPDGQHKLTFTNGVSTICDILVGADGAHSRIRPLLSPATPIYTGITGAEISLPPDVGQCLRERLRN